MRRVQRTDDAWADAEQVRQESNAGWSRVDVEFRLLADPWFGEAVARLVPFHAVLAFFRVRIELVENGECQRREDDETVVPEIIEKRVDDGFGAAFDFADFLHGRMDEQRVAGADARAFKICFK